MSDDDSPLPALVTERAGVSLVSYIVAKKLHWLFREQSVADLGVDGQIEVLTCSGQRTGKVCGVQIKAGASYFETTTADGFVFNATAEHIEYWQWHSLPIILVLVELRREVCYWVPITQRTVRRSARGGWQVVVPFTNRLDDEAATQLLAFIERDVGEDSALMPPTAAVDMVPKKGTLEWTSWHDQFFWHSAAHAVVATLARETPTGSDPNDPCGAYLRGASRRSRRKNIPSGDWVFGHLMASLIGDIAQKRIVQEREYSLIRIPGCERDDQTFAEWLSALQPPGDRPFARALAKKQIDEFFKHGGAYLIASIVMHMEWFGPMRGERVQRILDQLASGSDQIDTSMWALEHEEHYLESVITNGERMVRLTPKAVRLVEESQNRGESGKGGDADHDAPAS